MTGYKDQPCPLLRLRALLRDVAAYLVCLPEPCRVFLGFDSIRSPPLKEGRLAIYNFL
jgi:hypothetical protein